MVPLFLRPAPFSGLSLLTSLTEAHAAPDIPFSDLRITPRYPTRSPLEDVLRLVAPGSDEFVTEGYAFALGQVLDLWSQSFIAGNLQDLRKTLSAELEAASLIPIEEVRLREESSVVCVRRDFPGVFTRGSDRFLHELAVWIGSDTTAESAEFEIISLRVPSNTPLLVQTEVRYSVVLHNREQRREQRTGTWHMDWTCSSKPEEIDAWKLARWRAGKETQAITQGSVFMDQTRSALGSNSSFHAQMLYGSDHWRSVLDGACGIDIYGNNGVAAGDFDNDGFDDLYVCQPAGLPNRLYRNRGDGTFDDVTEKAGVSVLDNTACALFADFRNCGLQDLLVVCGNGPLLFLNQGDGTFLPKRNAFHFAKAPLGTFTHAAIADYDRDGRLDIYFCLYSYYLGLDQYHYPAPYFDARNGPPNFLLHNDGDGTFTDRTEAAGLHVENDRYSFACAWSESSSSNMPDLYVVNDFGRNNLYLSNGDGTFRASSTKSHVEDVGAGMSACWTDYNNDQRQDLYVANMWSAAGQRVSEQERFHEHAPASTRELYRRHARGNALYRNEGSGSFSNVSERAGVEKGGWAWCSDALDFDHDGHSDLYIANGYISAPKARVAAKDQGDSASGGVQNDLGSFFWRQVVAKSPEDATPSLAYEHGWNALNELIRSDGSWSGHERNVLLANNRDGTFSEISGALKLDFQEDGRSFALADLDHDGRLEIVLKNRNAPQLRILHNGMDGLGDSIIFRLRGTKSNRDAIGTVITVVAGELRQTKDLQSGTGFLAQHSKELLFGLGKSPGAVTATVRWPSGLTQHFTNLPKNNRIQLVEGEESVTGKPFASVMKAGDSATQAEPILSEASTLASTETWLVDPLKAPGFSLPDLGGTLQTLASMRGHWVLLYFWVAGSQFCRDQLEIFRQQTRALAAHDLRVVAINLDAAEGLDQARALVQKSKLPYATLFGTDEVAGIYNIVYRYLFDRRRNLALPTSFLLDQAGMIVKIYQGAFEPARVLEDTREVPLTAADRMRKALPFRGTLHQGDFVRNDFTYGVAMFQHGYLDQAAESFEQVVAAKPENAEGFYNLGTLSLRRNNFVQARVYLQQTLKLKPNYPEAWNNLGMMAAQEGHAEEAIENFRQSLLLRPSYATALLNLGNVYRHQRDFMQAQECLIRALKLQPDDPETSYSLGMLYAQQDQLQPASAYLQKAIELRPDYPEALNNYGVLLIREDQSEKAEQQFRICIRVAPRFEDSYLNLARLYVLQRRKERARDALADLLRVHPENVPAKQGLETLSTMP